MILAGSINRGKYCLKLKRLLFIVLLNFCCLWSLCSPTAAFITSIKKIRSITW